jgi:hypothetical protein
MNTRAYILMVAVLFTVCCAIPRSVDMSDSKFEEFRRAIAAVDRKSLGFSSIAQHERGWLEGASLFAFASNYDAMLHLGDNPSRTIAFRKTVDGYQWIGEQEIHVGPNEYDSGDGRFHEQISITHELVSIATHGMPLGVTSISYFGRDPRLSGHPTLTLEDIGPILEEWAKR